ncbi:single-stranded DNA-binding protein [Cryobacterium sp. Y11]|uniref:single-stranded DNA-binding protein n=1 Tax=Cryobacterium sp. Y11 TaxID=2045016 RepID=UPI000CE34880|nr:single-stranded DNA-binding protein [Cryobacterium sp. Y11]
MSERITVFGVIGTDPHTSVGKNGAPITSFRLASRQSHFDQAKKEWVDDPTSWFSVSTFRRLAQNAAQSLHKGEHVIVSGKLLVRNWSNAERSGTDVDILADVVGHDLTWYTTTPVRSAQPSKANASPEAPDPVESAESVESATAYESDSGHIDRFDDGFVPAPTGADQDTFARLDS